MKGAPQKNFWSKKRSRISAQKVAIIGLDEVKMTFTPKRPENKDTSITPSKIPKSCAKLLCNSSHLLQRNKKTFQVFGNGRYHSGSIRRSRQTIGVSVRQSSRIFKGNGIFQLRGPNSLQILPEYIVHSISFYGISPPWRIDLVSYHYLVIWETLKVRISKQVSACVSYLKFASREYVFLNYSGAFSARLNTILQHSWNSEWEASMRDLSHTWVQSILVEHGPLAVSCLASQVPIRPKQRRANL